MSRTARPLRRRPTWLRSLRAGLRATVVLAVGIPLLLGSAGLTAGYLLLYGDLPILVPRPNETLQAQPSHVYLGGQEIAIFRQYDITQPVTPEDIPQVLKDAVVAAEDRNFWDHEGVDPIGIVRAAVANYTSGETVQGGSTITQQYIKKTYLSAERTVERKLTEAILAARLEEEMDKEEILFHYLDTTYFGGGAYGVGAAADTYFRKPVNDLTLSEAATLASVIPAPSRYGPRDDLDLAEKRRKNVLLIMLEEEMITDAEYEAAKAEVLWPSIFGFPPGPATMFYPPPDKGAFAYPFYVDYIERYLVAKYGPDLVYRGGLHIEAALDPNLQRLAEETVNAELEGQDPELGMSLVSVEPTTGQVKALVGGKDWTTSQVNLALSGDLGGSVGFQPGSSFKTFTLVTALEQGYSPDTKYPAPGIWKIPGCTGGKCTVRGGGGGEMTLSQATARSTNTVFAQLAFDVGPDNIAEVAHRMGIASFGGEPWTPERDFNYTITLGSYEVSPLDMAAAYAVLANHGVKPGATPVVRVTKPDGTVLEDNSLPHGERVLNAAVADWTTEMLTGVIDYGTARQRGRIGRPAAGKTGSAQENRAAWFAGYTPQLSTAVWIGYPDLPRTVLVDGAVVYGGTVPARTWATFMKAAHEGLPVLDFAVPGFLPAPSGDVRIAEMDRQDQWFIPPDCDGPCDSTPVLTTPPPPEDDDDEDDDEDDEDDDDAPVSENDTPDFAD